MKSSRSVMASVGKVKSVKSNRVQVKKLPLKSLIILITVALMNSSCSPKQANDPSVSQQQQQEIECNIKNSYARLAAERTDICPKLLQKDINSNIIQRVSEVMVDDYCDYFLYLDGGQYVDISLDNRQIEALLIVPTIHDFANGKYKVASYDKHVIRLAYNGATYKPERLNYDVEITITD